MQIFRSAIFLSKNRPCKTTFQFDGFTRFKITLYIAFCRDKMGLSSVVEVGSLFPENAKFLDLIIIFEILNLINLFINKYLFFCSIV